MTKQAAIQAMESGKKVTHTYFDDGEGNDGVKIMMSSRSRRTYRLNFKIIRL